VQQDFADNFFQRTAHAALRQDAIKLCAALRVSAKGVKSPHSPQYQNEE
jgi:hypothetical protein